MPIDVVIDLEPPRWSGDTTIDSIVYEVLAFATEIARDEVEAIWPVGKDPRQPRSFQLFRTNGLQVVNEAPYIQHVHRVGERGLTIVENEVEQVAKESAQEAVRVTEQELGDKLDAAVYDILRETLGR